MFGQNRRRCWDVTQRLLVVTEVSRQPIVPVFKGADVQEGGWFSRKVEREPQEQSGSRLKSRISRS